MQTAHGTSIIQIQLGDAGGIETSGYSGSTLSINTTPTASISAHSTGFLTEGINGATIVLHGSIILSLENSTTNTWAFTCGLGRSDVSTAVGGFGGGTKSLSAALTQVRITTVNGTDAFDAGAINIQYAP